MALKVWLPLNGTLENKGISNVVPIVTGTTTYINGKIGQCLSCNGASYWTIDNLTLTDNTSICCWAKTSTNGKMPWVLFSDACNWLNLYVNSNYCLNTGDSNQNLFKTSSNTNIAVLTDGLWHHYVVTWNGIECLLYIDGEYCGKALTYKSPVTTNNKICIAGNYKNGHSYDWNGSINDFRIYDHCLSAKEVKEISQGLILHYKLDGWSGGVGDNILTGTATQTTLMTSSCGVNGTTTNATGKWGYGSGGNGTCTLIDISNDTPVPGVYNGFSVANNTSGNRDFQQGNQPYKNGVTYTVSWYARGKCTCFVRQWNTTDGKQMLSKTFSLNTTEWTYLTWTFTATEELETDVCTLHLGLTGSGSIEFCAMKMEIGSIATPWSPSPKDIEVNIAKIVDSSGYNNNATIQGSLSTISNANRYNISTIFKGSFVDYIYRPVLDFLKTNFTISCWGYIKTLPSYRAMLVSNGGKDSISHGVDLYINSSGIPYFMIANNNTAYYASSPDALNLNTWYLFTCTYDGSAMKLYINGELKKITNASIEPDYDTTPIAFVVGKMGHSYTNTGGYFAFNGYINDVRVYATALSADDILDLYHTPANIDNLNRLHTFELNETFEKELIKDFSRLGVTSYTTGSAKCTKEGITYTGKVWAPSGYIASDYIPIKNSGYTYYYDITYSNTGGGMFYIGFERFDENKTATSNSSCVYPVGETTERNYYRKTGTVNFSTDANGNPVKYIRVRILTDWNNSARDNTRVAKIHHLSIKEVPNTNHNELKIYENGIYEGDEIFELNENISRIKNTGLSEYNGFIEK